MQIKKHFLFPKTKRIENIGYGTHFNKNKKVPVRLRRRFFFTNHNTHQKIVLYKHIVNCNISSRLIILWLEIAFYKFYKFSETYYLFIVGKINPLHSSISDFNFFNFI